MPKLLGTSGTDTGTAAPDPGLSYWVPVGPIPAPLRSKLLGTAANRRRCRLPGVHDRTGAGAKAKHNRHRCRRP